MTHFSVDAKSCYDGTCKNFSKFYGPKDETVDGSKLIKNPKCAGYYFKRQKESVRKLTLHLNSYNEKLSSVWGYCSIYSPEYFKKGLGFRYPDDRLKTNNDIIQVGLNDCYKNQEDNKWCNNCSDNWYNELRYLNCCLIFL